MPTVAQEALAVAQAAADEAGGELDWELVQAECDRRLAERHKQLLGDARASWRAMDGWAAVESREEWEQVVARADDDYGRGAFLLERLGAHRYLDPPLMATLLSLRRRLVEEHGATTAAELMLIDSAMIAFYHQLRVTDWIGDLSIWLEREFFGIQGLTAKLRDRHGYGAESIRGLKAEDIVERLVERLVPLLDRSNRMLLRNLKALKALREPSTPSVSIGAAGQVNVATAQVNSGQAGRTEGQEARGGHRELLDLRLRRVRADGAGGAAAVLAPLPGAHTQGAGLSPGARDAGRQDPERAQPLARRQVDRAAH
jgi:hypothetical protein